MLLIFLISTLLLLIHLWLYPRWMRQQASGQAVADTAATAVWARRQVVVLIPCYNEARSLRFKLNNLLKQRFPGAQLTVRVVLDGCSDNSAAVAAEFRVAYQQQGIRLQLFNHRHNRGKCFRLNQHLPRLQPRCDWVLLSDCSALLSHDALAQVDGYFNVPDVGAVSGAYCHGMDRRLHQHWQQLNQLRQGEGASGHLMGGTGAALALRSHLIQPLPADCINDDFALVMQVIAQGQKAVLAPQLKAVDIAPRSSEALFAQRRRIAAGNVQQLAPLWQAMRAKAWPQRLMALCGKGLRAAVPMLVPVMLLSALAVLSQWLGALVALAAMLPVVVVLLWPHVGGKGTVAHLSLALQGATMGCLGALVGIRPSWQGRTQPASSRRAWQPSSAPQTPPQTADNAMLDQGEPYQPPLVSGIKRSVDLLFSLLGLGLVAPLLPLVALAIKLDSTGPVFYRQLRVGARYADKTELIYITKFRTMTVDAEATGAQWARPNDQRITRVGAVLRATRLDELPQLWQVLTGQLSLVGPRPERPQFCGELEQRLPFYLERTYGLRPGLTGLAQVNQAGDTCLEDVQTKLQFDHAYAAALCSISTYLLMELQVLTKTVWVVLAAKGH
ncbi:sugar transferase [uncultured Ferrimonas sp.]|uniref:sugar transferase n=1 Tax=uncultured Ferrimonas sp. TaxID=432640 RepID=UPI002614037B|nr:sugar transferase [uncultured Ferrimonas sp.]